LVDPCSGHFAARTRKQEFRTYMVPWSPRSLTSGPERFNAEACHAEAIKDQSQYQQVVEADHQREHFGKAAQDRPGDIGPEIHVGLVAISKYAAENDAGKENR